MEFKIKERKHPNKEKYSQDNFKLAHKFAEEIKKELGDFLKSAILFGSSARKEEAYTAHDIDILLIINDLTIIVNEEVIEAYRIITNNVASRISKRLHITTMKLTNFWDFIRVGDPISINMLRDGVPLIDVGIFEPMQMLLFQGRIRPTKESIWAYYARAPNTILNSEWHVMQACLDLYWAVIDAAHAALMQVGEIPPTPSEVSKLMDEKLVKKKLTSKKYVDTMKFFFELSKKIQNREVQNISGKDYDNYKREAQEFIKEMGKIIKG